MTSPSITAVEPRAVVCVIDHLHRDRRVADDARDGRFTHAGVTLTLGTSPDWTTAGVADDEEWRIEWVKFYEGLDLAHALQNTGDPAYREAWETLVVSFCAQVPVGHDSSDVSARRIQNWLYAWCRFAAAGPEGALSPSAATTVVGRLREDVAHLRTHLTAERNHRTLELYALLVAALALPDALDPDGTLAAFALAELATNARTDIWADGTHRECSTDYHHIVLRSLLGAVANARHFGLALDDDYLTRVHLACDFALHVQRPDGTIPSFSDGDNGDFRDVLALGAELLDRPDLAWVATAGRDGQPPAARAVTFRVGGYVVQRSGWGDGTTAYGDERFALLDCGPLGDGGHGHYDQLHVELVAGRHVLAVDPGRYTYAEGPWRHWFKGTAAHNTVTVDGADQTPYRRGKPKGPTSTAALVSRSSCDLVDLVVATVESPSYDARHTRRLAFCAGSYWVVHDVLRAPTTHRYELRWHLPVDAMSSVALTRDGDTSTVTTAHATYVIAGADTTTIEQGWVSTTYGVKEPAPVVVATVRGGDADLLTVVLPGASARAHVVRVGADGCTVGVAGVDDPTGGAGAEAMDVFHWRSVAGVLPAAVGWTHAEASWNRHLPERPNIVRVLDRDGGSWSTS